MYDELVKRLRAQAVYLPEKFSKNADLLDILMKAADALEGLQKRVPPVPHGRLIDADALRAKQQEDADLFQRSTAYCDKCRRDEAMNAVANIVNAPTVIEAEEGE